MTSPIAGTHALPAERAVISSVFIDPNIMGWVELSPEDFYDPKHRTIWGTMQTLAARGLAIDQATLETELTARGRFDAAGGNATLSEIAVEALTADNVEHYALQVREAKEAREVLLALGGVSHGLTSGELAHGDAIDAAVSALSDIQRGARCRPTSVADRAKDLIAKIIEEAEVNSRGGTPASHIPTGIPGIDLPCWVPSVVGARPGEGKSAFILQAALECVASGRRATIYTLEDPDGKWDRRLLARFSGVENRQVQRSSLSSPELSRVISAADRLQKLDKLDIVHAHGMTAQEISRSARNYARQGNLGLVAIDYVQLVSDPHRGMKRHDSIAASARTFANLAGKEGCAVLIASQLLKSMEQEQRPPRLDDLRYGEGLGMSAKLVVLLHSPRDDEELHLLVPKENNGQKNRRIRARFDRPGMRITQGA